MRSYRGHRDRSPQEYGGASSSSSSSAAAPNPKEDQLKEEYAHFMRQDESALRRRLANTPGVGTFLASHPEAKGNSIMEILEPFSKHHLAAILARLSV